MTNEQLDALQHASRTEYFSGTPADVVSFQYNQAINYYRDARDKFQSAQQNLERTAEALRQWKKALDVVIPTQAVGS